MTERASPPGAHPDPLREIFDVAPLHEQLRRLFDARPTAPALHIDGRWLSYDELGRAVYRTANALTGVGAAPGGRVAVMLPNCEALVTTWLALALLNVAMAPINTALVGAGLRHILVSAAPDLLIVDAALLPAILDAGGEALPRTVITVTPPPPSPQGKGALMNPPSRRGEGGRGERFLSLSSLLAQASDTPPPAVTVRPEDLALIIYTSGTTGPSKGVMLSRTAQLWHGLNYLRDFIQLGPGETGYTPLPLFHVSAQGFTLGCLLGGAAVAVDARFRPFAFWDAVRRHNAKAFNYVGAMIPLLYHRPPRLDDADNPARLAVGSATAPELHEPFERRFGMRLIECYGQTEMAGLWLAGPPDGRKIGTQGKPARWLEAAIRRADGSEAAPDEVGEITLRPLHPLLMAEGYFRDPQATARAFRDGRYWTGDAGSRDTGGYFRFRGRLKDFIRRRGENISAFEIEREALSHPAVREAAAAAVPSTLGEDEVKLSVILHDGATLNPADLDRYLRRRLAAFMRPRYIEFRADFPRTPTQRVQKFKLTAEGVPPGGWDRKARYRQAGD